MVEKEEEHRRISEKHRQRLAKQRNFLVSQSRKTKLSYYLPFNEKDVKNNQNFWSSVIPLLSNKFAYSEKITLIENEKVITEII